MKKSYICIYLLITILLITLTIFIKNSKSFEISKEQDVIFAMTLNGKSINDFPARGKYIVNVNCQNAIGKWDAEEWKLIVDDISGKVICNLDFLSNPSTMTNLVESKILDSGNAFYKVNETAIWENIETESDYGTITNNSTAPYSFDGTTNKWTGTATSTSTSTFKFIPKKSGFYQVCYELPSTSSTKTASTYKNFIRFYKLNTTSTILTTIYSNINNGDLITGCYDYGYVSTNDYIYLSGKYYDANISFYAKKTEDYITLDSGFRYEGNNPDNYVWFNDEMWRIIGSIPTKIDSNGTYENLVKIVRKDSIDGLAFDAKDADFTTEWGNNTLYTLLNSYYLGKKDGTNTDYCYFYSNTTKAKCNYNAIGIDSDSYYGKMIKNVYWNTGSSERLVTANQVYKNEIANQTVLGKIGLINASDYGYAVNTTSSLPNYSETTIVLNNWLYTGDSMWTITPEFNISNSGSCSKITYTNYVLSAASIRPVVYLDSSVYVVSGDGTEANPYQIAM